jgi:hypothetical protein
MNYRTTVSADRLERLAIQAQNNTLLPNIALSKEDRLLAIICEIEARADRRIFCDEGALSHMVTIRDLAREALELRTGSQANPTFAPRPGRKPSRTLTPTDRWKAIGAAR